jgi:hypothetical protein
MHCNDERIVLLPAFLPSVLECPTPVLFRKKKLRGTLAQKNNDQSREHRNVYP